MSKSMTNGNIPKHLIGFAIPMVLGNLFQLTYNMMDSIIVGRYVGEEALAAVGAASPIMNLVIFFIVGICMGTSVLMSEYYGAGEKEKLKREISTSMIVGLSFTIIVSILGLGLVRPILKLTQTPQEIIKLSSNYLSIVFFGLIFTFLYNLYSATLRSMGDSKTPIYFLIFSSVLNIILDLLLVVKCGMGVKGVAIATVIAQASASLFCVIYVYFKIPYLRFKKSEWVVDAKLLKDTLNYSWVTAMQQSCLYIGKLLVQGVVNTLGVSSIATFNAVTRIDDFVFTPQQSIAQAMTTFIAQNRGAKEDKRIKDGFRYGMYIEVIYWLIVLSVVYFNASRIMGLFMQEGQGQVIGLGSAYLQTMAFFYIMPALTNGLQGYFRGMGDLKITLVSTFVQIVGRVLFAYLLAPKMGITGIAYSCFIGWVVMLLYEVPMYIKHKKYLRHIKRTK